MIKTTSMMTAGACLLFLSAASSHGETTLFFSDMSPPGHDGAEYSVDGVPDQWWPGSTGDDILWLTEGDPVTNYFLQGSQGSESGASINIRSRWFSDFGVDFSLYQGQDFTITFDLMVSDGATGRLDFRMEQFGIGENNLVMNSQNGLDDFGAEWNGTASITAIGDDWHAVTLTGTLDENVDNMDIWFAPWDQVGGAHFVGTYGIDNVEMTAVPEPSTYALFGGLLALGVCLVRRRLGRNAAAKA